MTSFRRSTSCCARPSCRSTRAPCRFAPRPECRPAIPPRTPTTLEAIAMPKVIYEKRAEVAYITLNRPEVHNAIDLETHQLLRSVWEDFRDDTKLRVAILTGACDQ